MISVIIPTLNEEKNIANTLACVIGQQMECEILVVDGGSTDKTIHLARQYPGVKVLHSERGRAMQMNTGAQHATGNMLLFLHADTQLPPLGLAAVYEAMLAPEVTAGCFYLTFDIKNWLYSLYSACSRINHRLFTYGDQALFVRKEVFTQVGGYQVLPIMEDYEIQKRLRKTGRFIKLAMPVQTSARRFEQKGIVKQQLLNIGLMCAYHAGVSPHKIKRLYNDMR
jgi:rSAM/selenodomain-associated transferase 2